MSPPRNPPQPTADTDALIDHLTSINEAESIGHLIKRERMAQDLTPQQLAEQVGVGVPHISKVEAGRENPSDDLVQRLASALDLDV